MTFKRATTIGALMLSLGTGAWVVTTGAWAQGDFRGTVQHIDPSTRTIYFTDGRIMQLKPGAMLYVDGRAVSIDDLVPGARAQMNGDALASPSTETVAVVTAPAHPAIDAAGTVASVDAQAGLITFTDGRVVRASEATHVWQPVPLASLQPGMHVVVSQVQPAMTSGAVPSGAASTTVVTSGPATVTTAPGAVVVTSPTRGERHATTTRAARASRGDRSPYGSALPRFGFDAAVSPGGVQVLFPPQAP